MKAEATILFLGLMSTAGLRVGHLAAAEKPKGHVGSTDKGNERATGRDDRDFDPNVNQRPPR